MLVRLAFFMFLFACAPLDRLQRSYAENTGVWQTVSRDAEVFRDGPDHVLARAIILENADDTRYYLSLSFLRGGPNGPRISTVMQDDLKLDYVMHDRLKAYCIDRCHKTETGQIRLTKSQFRAAANTGLALEIDGLRRNYTARVPARLFYSALEAAGLPGPMRNPQPKI